MWISTKNDQEKEKENRAYKHSECITRENSEHTAGHGGIKVRPEKAVNASPESKHNSREARKASLQERKANQNKETCDVESHDLKAHENTDDYIWTQKA